MVLGKIAVDLLFGGEMNTLSDWVNILRVTSQLSDGELRELYAVLSDTEKALQEISKRTVVRKVRGPGGDWIEKRTAGTDARIALRALGRGSEIV